MRVNSGNEGERVVQRAKGKRREGVWVVQMVRRKKEEGDAGNQIGNGEVRCVQRAEGKKEEGNAGRWKRQRERGQCSLSDRRIIREE